MRAAKLSSFKLWVVPFVLVTAALPAFAQVEVPITAGRPTDWTHHRLVFSDAAKPAVASHKLADESRRQAIVHDVRFRLQQMRRDPSLRPDLLPGSGPRLDQTPRADTIHKDWSVTLSAGLVNPNAYPAKFSFSTTTFSCTDDFVVYPTGVAGADISQPTIVAYNELYGTTTTGCANNPVPQVDWAYDTAYPRNSTTNDGSTVKTSPVLSLDGTQVAFIQVDSSNNAALVILKWASNTSTVALDTTNSNVTAARYRNCTAPCMVRFALAGHNDAWSAPFYDYANDILYVGDNAGELHQFANVFLSGTPNEAANVQLGATILGSPVYDAASGNVFVGSQEGILYSVTASTMTLSASSATLAGTANAGIFDAPLVDSTAGTVYVFVANGIGGITGCPTAGDNCVYQFPTNFTGTATATGTGEDLGRGGGGAGGRFLFDGDFDNIYYSSPGGTAGNLYVVGNTRPANGSRLYRVPISGTGAMGTPGSTRLNNTANTTQPYPSPLTEFCNNGTSPCTASGTMTTAGTDYIFVSVYNATACATTSGIGCVLAYDVSSGALGAVTTLSENYGSTFDCFVTGGIVVDNAIPSGTEAGASEIYFMGLGSPTTNLCTTAVGSGTLTGVQSTQ